MRCAHFLWQKKNVSRRRSRASPPLSLEWPQLRAFPTLEATLESLHLWARARSARYRERAHALVNHPHPRDEGARTAGLRASTLGGPVTTGRPGTWRPQAREGKPAVSVKPRHFASRPTPPAFPVFPSPTRAASRPSSRPSMRPHSLERLPYHTDPFQSFGDPAWH